VSLSASALEKKLLDALRSSKNLAREPDDFLSKHLSSDDYSRESLNQARLAIYRSVYYSFTRDLCLDENEQRKIVQVVRLLDLGDDEVTKSNYQVGLSVYKKRFREVTERGELPPEEQASLDRIQKFFGLHRQDINQAIADQALAYYSFALADALKDNVVSEEELERLALIVRQFVLSQDRRGKVSVPQKREILRTSLANIKATGAVTDEDRAYIRALVDHLNAAELLKPCLMDLDLYEKIFSIRKGQLPECDAGTLLLESGEHLHFKAPILFESVSGGSTKTQKGTLYVGTAKIRFVGLKRSYEIRYKNILEISLKQLKTPKIFISVSSGTGGGSYRLAKTKDPGTLIELQEIIIFLRRKALRLLEPRAKTTTHIDPHVRSEVWYRDNGQCVLCGSTHYLEFDHIIPRSKGGANSIDNLQILCRGCNAAKSNHV
jgi:hypothetical protein